MHHRAGLARELDAEGIPEDRREAFMDAVVACGSGSELPAMATQRERAMLEYALKLTRTPSKMTAEDLEPLRQAGLDDPQILQVNQVASYFAYVNRVVDGLGVQLELKNRPE